MFVSVAKSDYFLERARQICLSSGRERTRKHLGSEENFFSPEFIDVYIMCATALEAFINERISISLIVCKQRIAMNIQNLRDEGQAYSDENLKRVLELLVDQDLQTKYRMMPVLLWQKAFDEGKYPFQDFICLVAIRNDIIHYKMPFYDGRDKQPKWAKKLEEKHIFLSKPVVQPPEPLPNEGQRVWIDEICTLQGAKWAYNTSCAIVRQFIELSKGEPWITCKPWADSLVEL